MYLAETASESILNEYYNSYAHHVKSQLTEFLKGKVLTCNIKKSKSIFECKLIKDSPLWKLVEKYTHDENLQRLLIGDFGTLLEIIDEIRGIDDQFNKQISKTKHKITTKDLVYKVEDSHAIFTEVMINNIFKKPIMNKTRLIEMKHMTICPYCGDYSVVPEKKAHSTVPPPIDHYLPKSKFPYFGISFYNLFPVCVHCNQLTNKGDLSPLTDTYDEQLLMHPNQFDKTKFHFVASYNGQGDMQPNNFSISINYHGNENIKKGYNDIVAIESHYTNQCQTAKEIWKNLKCDNSQYIKFLKHIGCPINYTPSEVLGFEDSLEESRTTSKHKFRIDILNSLKGIS